MAPLTVPSMSFDGSDIVLRSSDGVAFHLHKSRLREASPHFRSMFAIAPPSAADPQTIQIELPASLLSHLVQFIYADQLQAAPCDLSPRTIDDAMVLLEASRKLELDGVEQQLLEGAFTCAIKAEENPLRAWAVAKHLGLQKVARERALDFLLSPTDYADKWGTMPELANVNALAFGKLVRTRTAITPRLREEFVRILWSYECNDCEYAPEVFEYEELYKFKGGRDAIREILGDTHPMAVDAGSPLVYLLAEKIITCESCKKWDPRRKVRAHTPGWSQSQLRHEIKRKNMFGRCLDAL